MSSLLMTEGKIQSKIIKFALPIFWGSLFQQMYNLIDALVVGNVLGKDALASITSTGSMIFLLVGFFAGIFGGAGVVISKYFGARDEQMVGKSVQTAVFFGIVSGVLLTVVGVLSTPAILRLMSIPQAIFADSVAYVQTYFWGIIFIALFNTASGIFQAVGDSKHPLYYLMLTSLINVVLDILFVAYMDMGVAGAAFATVLAQAISVMFAFYRLCRIDDIYRVNLKKITFDLSILKDMLKIGIPTGVQNSVISFANVVVQSNVNGFGPATMAGYGAYAKIEGFAFLPIGSFSMALTTFISQNLGAGHALRAKEGAKFGIISSCALAEIIGVIMFILAPLLISIFVPDPAVVQAGVAHARIVTPFFFVLAFSHCTSGILRGAGRSAVPMMVMLLCWCFIRVIYISVITKFIFDMSVISWAYPLTWTLSTMIFVFYYKKSNWTESAALAGNA